MSKKKFIKSLKILKVTIAILKAILADRELLKEEIRKELEAIKADYGDARRTRIEGPVDLLGEADLDS